MPEKKRVLISPLNWGLGHATRIIPIIYLLKSNGFEVVVATNRNAKSVILEEFPTIRIVDFPSCTLKYFGKNATLAIFLQLPKLLISTFKEYYQLKKVIKRIQPKVIISDNRYGFFSKKVPSIFITHQVSIKMPRIFSFLEKLAFKLHVKIIQNFHSCLIPDSSGEINLSGNLSHKFALPKNFHFIGILSRFNLYEKSKPKKRITDYLFILSGPEPQRTNFEKLAIEESKKQPYKKTIIVRGIFSPNSLLGHANCIIINNLNSKELSAEILNAKIIICRAGYSSIMDLVTLKKTAVLVPTSGQTEQEYLATHLAEKGLFTFCKQSNFNLKTETAKISVLNPKFNTFSSENKNIILLINKILQKEKEK